MQKWVRWLVLGIVAIILLSVAYVIFNFVFLNFFVNLWWFDSQNLKGYYLMRLFYRYLIFGAVTLVLFLIFFFNFWIASRYLGLSPDSCVMPDTAENERKTRRWMKMIQSGSMKIYTPISVFLAFPISVPFYERWEQGLLFFFGSSAGYRDIDLGLDISFFLFGYPIYEFLQSQLMMVFIFLFAFLFILYFVENRLLCRIEEVIPKGAKIHLAIVALIVVLLQTWGFLLKIVELQYVETHEPIFYGPGFIENWIDIPLILLTTFTFLGTAVSFLLFFFKRKFLKAGVVFAAFFLIFLGVYNTTSLHESVDKYVVQPNEMIREKPFIETSVASTLKAYKLDQVITDNLRVTQNLDLEKNPALQDALSNIPVWDRELLDEVYRQLQGFRTYYSFPDVDEDRYTVADVYQQVNIGAREINLDDLPEAAQNWINRHLQYTHGYGVVMSPAAQGGEEPMTWFMRDIPLQSDYGITVREPRIYYGEQDYAYAIAPNDIGEIDHQRGDKDIMTDYAGSGGIPITTLLRKLLFSVYFNDRNIFFSTKTTSRSRILLRRNIVEAVNQITPYFLMDKDPYIVATPRGMFWIMDAYTTSAYFPNAHAYRTTDPASTFYGKDFNYIRNSVKIVIDAYNGTVMYYLADPEDPIADAYDRIYPGLLKPMSEMPEDLRNHVRYPRDLFAVQMAIFAKYHQTNPEQFYQDEDTWEFAKMSRGPMNPYYMTVSLKAGDDQGFILVSPMSPIGRDNLRSIVTVGCDVSNYGRVTVYSFPRGQQVYGPSQIEAQINQNSLIAQQLSLWDQAGSQVQFGRMVLLPLEDLILYIQPIYMISAKGLKIPELQRIIVSQGELVVMERTIEECIETLQKMLAMRLERIQRRFPAAEDGVLPAPAPPAPDIVPAPGTGNEAPMVPPPAPDIVPTPGTGNEALMVPPPAPAPEAETEAQ
ncbi:UPF0182 family protein [Desulfococcus sp.]|uniref:UPF0182 family protein n=1 Tax=Desulfococcus sp. TaxID=2025834 RepID=UPI003D0A4810